MPVCVFAGSGCAQQRDLPERSEKSRGSGWYISLDLLHMYSPPPPLPPSRVCVLNTPKGVCSTTDICQYHGVKNSSKILETLF